LLFLNVDANKNHDIAVYLQSEKKIMPANLNALRILASRLHNFTEKKLKNSNPAGWLELQ
jgi:hypothetical protein